MALVPTLPARPDDLARIVANPAESELRRCCAWEELTPTVDRVAKSVAPATGYYDLVTEAPSVMWERLSCPRTDSARYDPDRGSFVAWCHRILTRYAIDRMRERRRVQPFDEHSLQHLGFSCVGGAKVSSEETVDQLVQWSERLRRALDELAASGTLDNGDIDYHAILIVQLRLAVAKLLQAAGSVETIERFVPWTRTEQQRSFKRGWPSLCNLWAHLEKALLEPPHWVAGSSFCTLMAPLLPQGAHLTETLWLQWVRRAKTKAQDILERSTWDECFGRLLPDRRSRPSK